MSQVSEFRSSPSSVLEPALGALGAWRGPWGLSRPVLGAVAATGCSRPGPLRGALVGDTCDAWSGASLSDHGLRDEGATRANFFDDTSSEGGSCSCPDLWRESRGKAWADLGDLVPAADMQVFVRT